MARVHPSSEEASFFSLPQAKWAIGVLTMMIAVVGKEGLLGLILRQTRSEIATIVRDEEPDTTAAKAACFKNN